MRTIILSSLCFFTLLANAAQLEPTITSGSEAAARKYYSDISKILKGLNATPGVTTLDSLLEFAGYPASGDKLESLDPAVLMSPEPAASPDGLGLVPRGLGGATLREGDILAARFFAPKIVNISTAAPTPGWRKLLRLRIRPDSRAARVGVEATIILFNFLVATNEQPFTNHSFNTQAMLLAPAQKDRLFWLDFDADKKLALALNASFDAALLQSTGNHNYFVPDGCNACHGSPANFAPPMVNYLDTDHWFDRLDDPKFAGLKTAATALLFDAGSNDSTQPAFAKAFDVIRRFNEEALGQNSLVRSTSFEAQAARTWLKLHAQSDEHFPPVARGFSPTGAQPWQQSEAEGLDRLNRYCFRCHGSVHFSVFDRAAVLSRAGDIQQRINPSERQKQRIGFKMPPDQELDSHEIQALYNFLQDLK